MLSLTDTVMCKDTTIILSNNRNWTGPTGPLPTGRPVDRYRCDRSGTGVTGTTGVVVVPTDRSRYYN